MTGLTGIETVNALVVGGNGGIGFGFVQKLLSNPQIGTLYATYRRQESASQLFSLQQTDSNRLHCLPVDLTDESQISQAIAQIQEQTKTLHLVINCAGILQDEIVQPEKALRQLDPDRLLHYFQINSIGPVLLAKHLLPLFRHSERSIFATISAKIGSIGDNKLGGWYGYRASKAALNMFMRTTAIEYQRRSPHTLVILLHPGTTNTNLSQPFQRNVPPGKLFSVERTVNQLWHIIDNLEESDRSKFFSWDGTILPW